MGADFLEKRNHAYEKHIDRKRVQLATVDLLTQTPNEKPRCVVVKLKPGCDLAKGDKLIIEKRGDMLTGSRGNSVVAEVMKATPVISEAVSASSGVATGTVEKVNPISGTAELSIC